MLRYSWDQQINEKKKTMHRFIVDESENLSAKQLINCDI